MPRGAMTKIEALLAPISGPLPAGTDVRYAGDHDLIREARRADDPGLPQGVWRHDAKRADWVAVEALATETLTQRSKDLQVAAWLAEALVHRCRFQGLAPAMTLLRELCARYWDDLFPALEPDDATGRTAPFVWLNERLPNVLRELPVTAGPEEQPYSLADRERAQRLETIRNREPKAAERAEAGGAVTLASFEAELSATPDDELRRIVADVEAGTAEIVALESLLDRLIGPDAPSLGEIRRVLQHISGLLTTTLRNRPNRFVQAARQLVAGPPLAKVTDARRALPMAATLDTAPTSITTREEAYRRLAEVADFLLRNEPHSPVGPLLERALEWGAMPIDQLFQSLSSGRGAVPGLLDLLGLGTQDSDDGAEDRREEMTIEKSTYG